MGAPQSDLILPPIYKFFVIIMRPPRIWNFLTNMMEKSSPRVIGGILCRTRYIDDVLNNAIKEGVGAVVNLGTGMDTRAIFADDLQSLARNLSVFGFIIRLVVGKILIKNQTTTVI